MRLLIKLKDCTKGALSVNVCNEKLWAPPYVTNAINHWQYHELRIVDEQFLSWKNKEKYMYM